MANSDEVTSVDNAFWGTLNAQNKKNRFQWNYSSMKILTLQNIFDPVSPRFCEFGEHMTDMDLRSRENSRVKSLFMSSPNFELAALHLSWAERILVSVPKTFNFSTRTVNAVSVASPTFS